jgi:CBS domain-containing protein
MLCSEIMKSEIECLSPIDAADIAARKMRDHNIGFLPVCDEALHAVGTLTDRDITVRLVAQNLPLATPVGELMSMDVVACRPTDHVRKAEELMSLHRVSRILCVDDDGTIAGIISLSDIAQHESPALAVQTLKDVTAREALP